jgi:hypothetical protein
VNAFVHFIQKNIIALDKKFAGSFYLPWLIALNIRSYLVTRFVDRHKISVGMRAVVFYATGYKEHCN